VVTAPMPRADAEDREHRDEGAARKARTASRIVKRGSGMSAPGDMSSARDLRADVVYSYNGGDRVIVSTPARYRMSFGRSCPRIPYRLQVIFR
jgi:hypothetical protein